MKKKSIFLATALSIATLTSTAHAATSNIEAPVHPVMAPASTQEEAQQNKLEERLRMLEQAIVPTTPEETVNTWAKAVQIRNGALQYALGTQDVKESLKMTLEHYHWVTGGSSPWVETYKIVSMEEVNQIEKKYIIEFGLVTSTGFFKKDRAVIGVIKQGNQWFISSIAPESEESTGIWNTPESIKM